MSQELNRDPTEPEMVEIEAALGSLAPSRGRVDRDRVLFRAGQASARPSRRGWIAAAGLALLASGEAAMLARRPPPRVVERIVVVREPAEIPPPAAPVDPPTRPRSIPLEGAPGARGRLAWQVLRYGLDGLPAPVYQTGTVPDPRHVNPRELLLRELNQVLEAGDHS